MTDESLILDLLKRFITIEKDVADLKALADLKVVADKVTRLMEYQENNLKNNLFNKTKKPKDHSTYSFDGKVYCNLMLCSCICRPAPIP